MNPIRHNTQAWSHSYPIYRNIIVWNILYHTVFASTQSYTTVTPNCSSGTRPASLQFHSSPGHLPTAAQYFPVSCQAFRCGSVCRKSARLWSNFISILSSPRFPIESLKLTIGVLFRVALLSVDAAEHVACGPDCLNVGTSRLGLAASCYPGPEILRSLTVAFCSQCSIVRYPIFMVLSSGAPSVGIFLGVISKSHTQSGLRYAAYNSSQAAQGEIHVISDYAIRLQKNLLF